MKSRLSLLALGTALVLLLVSCNYDVALTEKPTRNIDEHLIGNWLGGEDGKDPMSIRQLSDTTYIVAFDNDIYRAFHSDLAGMDFVSVESLQAGRDHGRFVYLSWAISTDGSQLTLRTINTRLIPEETKGRVALQKLITANLPDAALFNEPMVFTRKKP